MADANQAVPPVIVQNNALRIPTNITLPKFSGAPNEDIVKFSRQLASSLEIGNIPAEMQHHYLHLNLSGGALAFYQQLPEEIQENFERALERLYQRYNPANHTQLYKIQFHARKFQQGTEQPADFLTELQRLALYAFPDIEANPEQHVQQENRNVERTRRVRDAFIKGLPQKHQRKLLQEPETTTVQDLCEKYTQRLMLENLLPENDVVTAFNQVAPPALSESERDTSEILQKLEEMKKQIDEMDKATKSSTSDQQGRSKNHNFQKQNFPNKWNQQNLNQNFVNRNQNRAPAPALFCQPRFANQGQFYRNRPVCKGCNKTGHSISKCWHINPHLRPQFLPYNTINNQNQQNKQASFNTVEYIPNNVENFSEYFVAPGCNQQPQMMSSHGALSNQTYQKNY